MGESVIIDMSLDPNGFYVEEIRDMVEQGVLDPVVINNGRITGTERSGWQE